MSNAEKKAWEWASKNKLGPYSMGQAYAEGYLQAEKDMELNWKDMSYIRLVFDAIEANIHLGSIKISPMTKEYYEEVLKRFKERKEK